MSDNKGRRSRDTKGAGLINIKSSAEMAYVKSLYSFKRMK